MFDLTKYSEQELDNLSKSILKEQRERRRKNFPYKVGDCFCDPEPGTSCKCWEIIRIDNLDNGGVEYTGIYIKANLDRNKYTSSCTYDFFLKNYKTPIDSSIFDEFSKSSKIISEEKSRFIRKVMELRYDKRRTPGPDLSE